ncbi:MAG TPA: hypothetical protein VG711_00510, partial [Phycisphaerales bacterium]|nr:hypothetical protein [Phycisphaerales bacterium]
RFCCPDCIKKFNADPAKYMKEIDDAVIAQQKDAYPLDVCPISGEKLDDSAVNYVAGVTLVRFCCSSCVKNFEKNPMPTMEKLHEAWMAKSGGSHGAAASHEDHHAEHSN